MLTGENGLIKKAIEAKEQTQIKTYAEKIELIKTELKLSNEGYADPTIEQLENEFDTNQTKWVNSTEKIIDEMDNDIEKLKLTTKEGYIFYITSTTTEYKGKGEVVDTSDLENADVIKLEIVGTVENGEKVQITDLSGKNYYKIKYKIGETGEWKEIQSGEQVEVAYGETIIAKLIYGSNEGQEHRLKVGHTSPTVEVSDIDLTNTVRKTNKSIADIFNVTWGSEGTGEIYYKVNGTLNFENTSFSSDNINNIAELEIGTYKIDCYVATPTQVENNESEHKEEWSKEINITELAETTVTNASNSTVSAKAIYSAYDFAYFRDLVNSESGNNTSINGKLINDIELENWEPIGYYDGVGNWTGISYKGIFDGNSKNITITSMTTDSKYKSTGIFGMVIGGTVKNIILNGKYASSTLHSAGIIGGLKDGKINNCINNCEVKNNSSIMTAGIVAGLENSVVENCVNNAYIEGNQITAGICAECYAVGTSQVRNCTNNGKIYGNGKINVTYVDQGQTFKFDICEVAGIVGYSAGNLTITKCSNAKDISSGSLSVPCVSGILSFGRNTVVQQCKNTSQVSTSYKSHNGAISGIGGALIKCTVKESFNTGNIKGNSASTVGGIIGFIITSNIYNCYNLGDVSGYSNIGGILGYASVEKTATEKNNLCNLYNGTSNVSGTYSIGNFGGDINYCTGDSITWVDGCTPNGKLANSSFTNVDTAYSISTMKSNTLLDFIKKGQGANLWARDSNNIINKGFPYLVNNIP